MKKLYICESHHHVLLPWAWTKQSHKELNLLTLDHHTDTHDAFLYYLYHHKNETLDALIAEIDFCNNSTIRNAISKLKNDEHINTSIECGIIKKAFIVSHDGSFDNPPSNEFTSIQQNIETKVQYHMGLISLPKDQTYPDKSLYTIGTSMYLDDENGISNDFLTTMLSKIQTMSGIDITNTKFILDIDLDYFHSYTSLKNYDLKEFRHLLSVATAITIATEPAFAFEGIDPEIILNEITTLAIKENVDLEIVDLR